ncbi:Uncharacterised protein [Mycobacteroides abscessus subsp. abscessus]|nr:Uncharacterised protein [Mycobacteroides abscessus subsp. abscessus]
MTRTHRGWLGLPGQQRRGLIAQIQDNPAHVLGAEHRLERPDDLFDREPRVWQRGELARGEHLGAFAPQLAEYLRAQPQHPVHIDRVERQITAEGLEIGCPAEVDIGLADLDDPAELPCDGKVLGNHLAGQRVVDHVDPTSFGDLQDVVDESDRP